MGSLIAGMVLMSHPHALCATVDWANSSVMMETAPAHISCVTQTTTVLMDLMRTLCCVVWKKNYAITLEHPFNLIYIN